jgi:threonine dehydrogenase-like Zn-dependent dehydrogenase
MPDKRREKVLVDNWKDPQGPTGNQIKTKTLFSGITNGTERNDLVNYTFNCGQCREIVIKQNSHFDRFELGEICRLVARGMVRIAPLIQYVVPATEAKRIYDTLRDEPNKLFGTVFDWK